MLKMTGMELELMTDSDMHLFVEQGIRGGVAVVSHRYCEAKNVKGVHIDYDETKKSTFLLYLDA